MRGAAGSTSRSRTSTLWGASDASDSHAAFLLLGDSLFKGEFPADWKSDHGDLTEGNSSTARELLAIFIGVRKLIELNSHVRAVYWFCDSASACLACASWSSRSWRLATILECLHAELDGRLLVPVWLRRDHPVIELIDAFGKDDKLR